MFDDRLLGFGTDWSEMSSAISCSERGPFRLAQGLRHPRAREGVSDRP